MALKRKETERHGIVNEINVIEISCVKHLNFDGRYYCVKRRSRDRCIVFTGGEAVLIGREKNGAFTERLQGEREISFFQPGELYSIRVSEKSSASISIISFRCDSPSMSFFNNYSGKIPGRMVNFLVSLINESRLTFSSDIEDPFQREMKIDPDAPLGSLQLLRSYLEQFLIFMLRGEAEGYSFPVRNKGADISARAVTIMNSRLYDKLNIEELCRLTGAGKTYLTSEFKRSFGYSPMRYYIKLKINEAQRLIEEGGHSFSNISDMLCFDNPHYFTRTFKRVTGMTPSQYSRKM